MRKRTENLKESETQEIKLSDGGAKIFENYTKLKSCLILWNLIIALLALIIFGIVLSRSLEGIKQPWLFKYAFSNERVFYAVHTVERKYQPSSLNYVEIIYIVLPIYL